MSHPRIEEVDDSDVGSDPSVADIDGIDDFADGEIMRRVDARSAASVPAPAPASASAASGLFYHNNPQLFPPPQQQSPIVTTQTDHKSLTALYPIYFDARCTRAGGRRVSARLAVANPLATSIAAACSALGLGPLLELDKTHPRDWANPGRVRVRLVDPATAKAVNPAVRNKHHLLLLVARHMAQHPTTDQSEALRMRVAGLPPHPSDQPWPRPAVPGGWRVNDLLPLFSPALTGGGVSEKQLADMMKGMQASGDPMAAMMSGLDVGEQEGGKSKEKKKKGKK